VGERPRIINLQPTKLHKVAADWIRRSMCPQQIGGTALRAPVGRTWGGPKQDRESRLATNIQRAARQGGVVASGVKTLPEEQ
jgi:hypothetical protein